MGTVEFSLLLLNSGRALKCIIHRAKGLYGTDYNGFSDPFVRVQLLPLTKTGDTKQTKTLHKTINPEFGETLVFHADEPLDARKLRLTVMDDYQFGSYPLGEATVPLSLLTPNQMCWLNVALDKCLDRDALCADRPRVLVSLMHCRRRRELHVGLLRCVRLRHAAAGTGPFVRITLKPDASQPSCETSTVKKMLSPQSNDEFAFELKENDNLEKKFLQISVWDKDQGRVDEYLGGLELGLHCKAAQLQHWLDVIRVPEQSFECWHALVPVPLLP
ncbi:double C2-like domain-containing protein beta [Ixodes scapularis]